MAASATALLLLTELALANDGPSFDCAKARGEVQAMICKDPGLAALDRQLDTVFKAATALAREAKPPPQLRAEQIGWIRGRDDCWKAEDVHACVEASYHMRIAELQSNWRLLPPRTVFYACGGSPANEVVINYFDTDPKTVRIERGDQTVTAFLLPNGSRYEGRNVSLLVRDRDVTVDWQGGTLNCQKR